MAAERGSRWLWATLVCTLGAFPVATLLAPPGSTPAPRALTWLLFLASSVHVASTGFLFSFADVRLQVRERPLRYVAAPVALISLAAATAVLVAPDQLVWLLLPYFAWQQVHYQKQNLGIAALAASSQGLRPLDRPERRALLVSGAAGAVGLVAHPGLLQLPVHPSAGPLFATAGVVLAGAVASGLLAVSRRTTADRPAAFTIAYVVGLLFSAPVFLFSSPYAAVGGMTIAHGLQYLLLVGHVGAGTDRGMTRFIAVGTVANVALVGGALLNGASHLHSSGTAALRAVYGAYLGIVMTHFVVDAGLWRLRDPAARAFLQSRIPLLVRPPSERPTASAR